MVDVRRVNLPGVGVLHSFITDDGGEVAVVAHRTGHSDLSPAPRAHDDDDAITVRLDEDEAHTLAELLGGTRIVESITELDELPGVPIDWVTVDDDDAIAGRRSATCPRHPVSPSSRSSATTTRTRRPPPTSWCRPATPSSRSDRPRASRRCSAPSARRRARRRRRGLMLQMMLRPRWVLALLLALGIAAGFALLGQWQLERAVSRPWSRSGRPRRCGRSPTSRSPTADRAGGDRAARRGHGHLRAGRHGDRRGPPQRRRRGLLGGRPPRGDGCRAGRPARRARLGGRPRDRACGRRPVRRAAPAAR